MRSWAIAGAIALGIAAIAIAFVPVSYVPIGAVGAPVLANGATCKSPVVSSFEKQHDEGQWFGYAPLTSTPLSAGFTLPTHLPTCRGMGRHRLIVAGFFAVGAFLLVRPPRRRVRALPKTLS